MNSGVEINLRGATALMRSTWASWMQYRGFFFVLAFGWMIPPLVTLFVWSAAAGSGSIGGFNRGEFVAYYLVLILVNQLTYAQTNWTLGDVIRQGSFNFWLLKPMHPLFNVLSSEAAGKVVYLAFVLPAALVLALILRPELHTTWPRVLLFIPALILAWALRFLWGAWLALLAFWSERSDALLAVQDSLVFLLSGVLAPVALLPGFMQTLARFLPFRYMVGFPVEVLVQPLSTGELAAGFVAQLIWLAIAAGLTTLVYKNGVRRYAAVGG